uniref:DDE Tnp4 domain-containing protein n=1 Tax=Photinus pyralis TaxID=7054 RepID=A0A1Y1LDP2_PHOPY
MAISNANYEFIMCDIGTNGRVSDGGVIRNTTFYELLVANKLKIPKVGNGALPYVFVADEAFTLRPDMLKPFSQKQLNYERRIFNYRLSRARRIIENVFGILVARFRIFHTDINLKLETTEIVTLCCCILHNFLCIKSSNHYIPPESTDQEDIGNATVTPGLASHGVFDELQRTPTNISANAKQTRQQYLEYFNGVGAVEWQDRMIVQRE